MRIVYVYPQIAVQGGVERILIDKMNFLSAQSGYDIHIVTYDQGEHPLAFALSERVRHTDLQVRTYTQYQYRGLRRLWEGVKCSCRLRSRMKRVLRQLAPDVVVCTTNGPLSLLNTLQGKTPLVVESHGGYHHLIDYADLSFAHRLDIRHRYHVLHQVSAIVTLTQQDAQRWRSQYAQVHVIPNIVHLNVSGRYAAGHSRRVIFVGRFAPQKGIPQLLAIWRLVYAQHPDWQLHLYGSGDERGLHDEAGIVVHEPDADIFPHYCESDLLVLTSRWEPFGLVLPEAMSCGLPVVSFEGDGPCDIITDGVDGFLVPQDDTAAFARRVCQLIEEPALRKQMASAAIASSSRYSAERIVPQWKELFENLNHNRYYKRYARTDGPIAEPLL